MTDRSDDLTHYIASLLREGDATAPYLPSRKWVKDCVLTAVGRSIVNAGIDDIVDALHSKMTGHPGDTERLDWMEAQRVRVLVPMLESSGWRICEWDGEGFAPIGPFRPTLREAIDAAMLAEEATDE
jgi:hypothetical protein